MSDESDNGRIAHFEEQVKAAEARLAAARMADAKREKTETKKLEGIIGAAILKELRALKEGTPENHKEAEALETILRGILQSIADTLTAGQKKLLRKKGLLP